MCRLWTQWDPVLRAAGYDARFLLPIRSPIEVARSLQRRNGIPISEGLSLWLRHVLDAEHVTRGRPRHVLRWDRFMQDWRSEADRIETALDLPLPERGVSASTEVDLFLSGDLKTVDASAGDLASGPDSHPWVRSAFEALTVLCDLDDDPQALKTLDRLRAEFDDASSLFGRSVGVLLADVEAAEQARDGAIREVGAVDEISRLLGLNLVQASEQREALARGLSRVEGELRAAKARAADDAVRSQLALGIEAEGRQVAEARLVDLDTQLATSALERDDALAAAASVRRARDVLTIRLDQAERECAEAAGRIGDAEQALAEARAQLTAETAQLNALHQSLVRRPIVSAWRVWAPAARRRLAAAVGRIGAGEG